MDRQLFGKAAGVFLDFSLKRNGWIIIIPKRQRKLHITCERKRLVSAKTICRSVAIPQYSATF
jgi:hypothetical protein